MFKIVFLRHGRSLADDENKFEGRYDSPLTEVGERQAGITTGKFKELSYGFDKIIASSLIRAGRTAEIINESYNVELIKEPLWMERNNGLIAGRIKNEETCKMFPMPENGFSLYDRRANGTGESTMQLYSRATLAVEKLLNYPEGKYLVVSHGGILNAVIQSIFGIKPTSDWEGSIGFGFGDNGFMELDYDKKKNNWTLRRFDSGLS